MIGAGWNRRRLLAAGGGAMASLTAAPASAIRPRMPAGACDCHTHVFLAPDRFPFSPDRIYTPPRADIAQLREHLSALDLDRVVIVSPSVYGSDVSATRFAIATLGQRLARGVSVYSPDTRGATLDQLHAHGFRGMRLNLHTIGVTDPGEAGRMLDTAAAQIGDRPWHVQVYAPMPLLLAVKDRLAHYPVPLVFDHYAGADGLQGPNQPGFAMIADLVQTGRAYVKLSAPYRVFGDRMPTDKIGSLVRAFMATNPARMLWASDWPHSGGPVSKPIAATAIRANYAIDDGRVLNDFLSFLSPAERQAVFVDNPARLYGFA